jgi:ArsR family transcriptional regulator
LKIASVPSKLKILRLLADKSHCVCDLIEHTKLSQTLISHHLADLSVNGLVESEKNGAFVDYSLTDKGRTLVLAIQVLNS